MINALKSPLGDLGAEIKLAKLEGRDKKSGGGVEV